MNDSFPESSTAATGRLLSHGAGNPGASHKRWRSPRRKDLCPLGGNRSLSGVLFPLAPTRNNPSHVHEGGAGSD
ncbi:MAG TPA: hypothetical protein DCY18_12135 [Thauera sp.]|nr:hypothetical protein [Thauera sp.]